MASPQKDTITLTPKQLGIILAAVLAVVGGFPIGVNKLTPDVRSDPFTGKDGERLKAEIRRECQSNLSHIQSQIDDIEESDTELHAEHSALRSAYDKHILWGREQTNVYNEALGRHEGQIQFLLNKP